MGYCVFPVYALANRTVLKNASYRLPLQWPLAEEKATAYTADKRWYRGDCDTFFLMRSS